MALQPTTVINGEFLLKTSYSTVFVLVRDSTQTIAGPCVYSVPERVAATERGIMRVITLLPCLLRT